MIDKDAVFRCLDGLSSASLVMYYGQSIENRSRSLLIVALALAISLSYDRR